MKIKYRSLISLSLMVLVYQGHTLKIAHAQPEATVNDSVSIVFNPDENAPEELQEVIRNFNVETRLRNAIEAEEFFQIIDEDPNQDLNIRLVVDAHYSFRRVGVIVIRYEEESIEFRGKLSLIDRRSAGNNCQKIIKGKGCRLIIWSFPLLGLENITRETTWSECVREAFEKVSDNLIEKLNECRPHPVPPPSLTPPSTNFTDSITISITCDTSDAIIHYTLDGSEPTISSPIYTDTPIILRRTTKIKAKAFRDGWISSDMASEDYIKVKLICPSNKIVCVKGEPIPVPVTFDEAITDPNTEIVYTPESGALFPLGATPVAVTVIDSSGNPTSCSFNVIVKKKCSKKPLIFSSISFVVSGISSYLLCQEAEDYNDRYCKEWDRSEAKRLKDKADDYKSASQITAGIGAVSIGAFLYYCWFKDCCFKERRIKNSLTLNNRYFTKIEHNAQGMKFSVVLKF